MVEVTLKNVVKKFGKVVAVDDLNLKIKNKEFHVLLGPSGCGKSTILNLIAGLETPTEGEIFFDNEMVNDVNPEKRDVAMVFQSYALYPHMKVFDVIAFSLKIRKTPKTEINTLVNDTAQMLGISDMLNRKPHELSGGERQRVALARAIVRKPKVFLLDEPLSNIDAKLRTSMRVELKKLHDKLKTTMIYVTHDQVEAMTMADRISLINKGRLIQLDSPLNIYQHPNQLFVADFIGSPPTNFIDCLPTFKEGKILLEAPGFSIELPKSISDSLGKIIGDKELVLGIRPEDISLHNKQSSKKQIKGKVYALEPLGSSIIIDVEIDKKLFKTEVPVGFETKINDDVWMSVNQEKIHLFDKENGKCIV